MSHHKIISDLKHPVILLFYLKMKRKNQCLTDMT